MLINFNFYCKRNGIPKRAHVYCTLYMFCIGLMMAVLRSKNVALIKLCSPCGVMLDAVMC